jgi:hypothetical protein
MILGVCNNGPVQKRQEDTSSIDVVHPRGYLVLFSVSYLTESKI